MIASKPKPKPKTSADAREKEAKVRRFIGAQPARQELVPILFRFRPELLARLDDIAARRGMNRTSLTMNVLADYLEKYEKGNSE